LSRSTVKGRRKRINKGKAIDRWWDWREEKGGGGESRFNSHIVLRKKTEPIPLNRDSNREGIKKNLGTGPPDSNSRGKSLPTSRCWIWCLYFQTNREEKRDQRKLSRNQRKKKGGKEKRYRFITHLLGAGLWLKQRGEGEKEAL